MKHFKVLVHSLVYLIEKSCIRVASWVSERFKSYDIRILQNIEKVWKLGGSRA